MVAPNPAVEFVAVGRETVARLMGAAGPVPAAAADTVRRDKHPVEVPGAATPSGVTAYWSLRRGHGT